MTFLPIVRRELTVAARRTATYRQRVAFGAVAVLCVAVLFAFSPSTRLSGKQIFQVISWAGFIICVLEGLRATADCIAMERREGTLGLLLLTDTRGRHVLIGKLGSACVQSLTAVISILPAFALPLLMGGVTAGECWRVMAALLAAMFVAIGAGLLASVLTRDSLAAFATALFLLAAVLIGPYALEALNDRPSGLHWLSGPTEMFFQVPDARFSARTFSLATSVAAGLFLSCIIIGGALLERQPRLEQTQRNGVLQRWLRPSIGRAEAWAGESANHSPAVWLAERTLPGRRVLWLIVIAGLIGCFLAGCFGGRDGLGIILAIEGFTAFVLKLWVGAVAPISFNQSRRNGALELLLCTPVSPSDLVRGQVDALYGYFLAPALVTSIVFPIFGLMGQGISGTAGSAQEFVIVFGFFWLAMFLLDLHALAYTGLWFGLTHARVDRAIAKTVFAVIILPWLTMVVPFVGCLGMLVWPIFWISWSSSRLKKQFRDVAVSQFSAEDDHSGWWPWSRRKASASSC